MTLQGLIPAVFTPMDADGALNLALVPAIVEQLVRDGVDGLYICGSTGEGPSLTREERMATAEAYIGAAGNLPAVVQVGHQSVREARTLADHAKASGASAISAVPPDYFKPGSLDALIDTLAEIAVPGLPFYYYHIPSMTGVEVDVVALLERGRERIPTLAGVKYSAHTVFEMQAALAVDDMNVVFGSDEMLLSALVAGAHGAVGSTYNFAAPLYGRILHALDRGDLLTAWREQGRSVEMVRVLVAHGGLPAFKAMMGLVGLDCGGPRLPLRGLDADAVAALRADMARIGFFEWGR